MDATYELEHGQVLHVMYFTEVANIEAITEKLISSTYPFIDCTCVNPQLILDSFQLAVAANKAVIRQHNDNLITKSLSTELLFNLSISENITGSLEKFGYGTRYGSNILLAIFSRKPEQWEDIKNAVKGHLQSNLLFDPQNLNLIKNAYDITDDHLSSSSLLNIIVTKIACKSI